MIRTQLTGIASNPGKHGQRRRCVRIPGLSSTQERHFPFLAKRGLWCRERNEVSGVARKDTIDMLLTAIRYTVSECNMVSRPTATCPQATSPTSRLATGLGPCTAVKFTQNLKLTCQELSTNTTLISSRHPPGLRHALRVPW